MGENGVRAGVPGERSTLFSLIVKVAIVIFFVSSRHEPPEGDPPLRSRPSRRPFLRILPKPLRGLPATGNGGVTPDRGSSSWSAWEPMRTATTGLAARAGGGRWAREWRCSPGSASPGRGRRPMRPSWRTATSGRGGPTRRRGSASARGRATSSRSSGGRPCATGDGGVRLGRPPASRARQGRRGGGGEVGAAPPPGVGGGLAACRALRARLEQMLAMPPETPAVAPPEPAGEMPEAIPDAGATPEEARETAGRGPTRWNDLTVARLSKLVVELEWAHPERGLAAPRDDRPADGDGRGDQGVPGPPSPLRPPAAALTRLTPPQIASPHDRPA